MFRSILKFICRAYKREEEGSSVYRIAKQDPWAIRAPKGDNRFDILNPSEPIFTLYTGETEEAALAEVLAPLRPSLREIAVINSIPCDHPRMEPELATISADWIAKRKLSSAEINGNLKFADITMPSEIATLRNGQVLAEKSNECGFQDIDDSSLKAGDVRGREFTQTVAAHYFNDNFHGIRYGSRLGAGYFCLAAFIPVSCTSIEKSLIIKRVTSSRQLSNTDPALLKVAAMYHLSIEGQQI